jgi:hypothetical protein
MLYAVVPQLLNGLHGRLGIWKEIATRRFMDRANGSAPKLSVNPFLWNPKPVRELCYRQTTGNGRPAAPLPRRLDAMPKANTANRTGEDLSPSPG